MLTYLGMALVGVAGLIILVTLLLFYYGKKIKTLPRLTFWWVLSLIMMGSGIVISLIGVVVLREKIG